MFLASLVSLHPGGRGKSLETGLQIKAAVNASLRARTAVHVSQNGNEVTALERTLNVGASGFHGCFLTAEAIEAATSLAILIWGSRLRSW